MNTHIPATWFSTPEDHRFRCRRCGVDLGATAQAKTRLREACVGTGGNYGCEQLGYEVRRAWLAWARAQPDPKPSWLTPYHDLSAADRDADVRIGAALLEVFMATLDQWHAGQITEGRLCQTLGLDRRAWRVFRDSIGLAQEEEAP